MIKKGILVYNIFYKLKQNNKITMHQLVHNQERDISSSEDNCRCQACRNQEQLKNYQRQNPSNIYMYKHLKKRGVPPVKKQLFSKELSHKAKYMTKKQELQKKFEPEKTTATPLKQRLIQVLKTKQAPTSSFFIDYHQVSHSQREKLPSKDGIVNNIEQSRRISNYQDLKSSAFQKQYRAKVGSMKLVQISENPQNIRLRYHNSRSLSQASASCNEQQSNDFKSLQKIKN